MGSTADMRHRYEKFELLEQDAGSDPFALFDRWFQLASQDGLIEANAMTLATVNAAGEPEARMVLLKSYSEDGFIFFTNYDSAKGQAIAHNPQVSLLFFWINQERQVRINGQAHKLSVADSTEYFNSRPYGSRIGAWASQQSQVVERKTLEQRFEEYAARYPDAVPKPPHWGGYLVVPSSFEFWQGRPSRMHDRLCYRKAKDQWLMTRLAP
ncbi:MULTISPECIES: pyridoxamine 5'-phosphate oxidase [Oligella]|uniref:Pyridoxine/pyridoxamine 5'-phosphate oxidase n=1 Tax=Oligella urethralis TaxID=90245 RepID=A0A2X1UL84_9BURK|nr:MULTISPECIES: pyridoxamine 5'-phosphate oxidase [Oligella]MDK6203247.1 pyridoxamine 5'-phosphate oxidase [Oligella urethralis]OFS83869.1 pyridoxamine 5'-phosphate oxidase [Oligella sp. HMSC05A10]SPY07912.1 Pyridoxine/pyridoxamine 5'-phosphate oxidase [Oligella urethralis]SUA62065.1 Pyridoxine/pyridoxamine 5'-phosphate oxidase [Oligella urethralis]